MASSRDWPNCDINLHLNRLQDYSPPILGCAPSGWVASAWRAHGERKGGTSCLYILSRHIVCLGRATIAAALFVVSPAILGVSSSAKAAEIKALFPAAMKSVMSELVPQFEKSSGYKLNIEYGTVGAIIARLKTGDAIDVAVVTDKQLPNLTKQGLISAEGQAVVARVGLDVFVRKGEPKLSISSVGDLKKALLASKTIVYGDPKLGDSSGIATEGILERLGIAAEIKPKAKLVVAGAKGETVAEGDADLGFDQMSNIVINPKIESLGPLPSALQHYTDYAGG